MSDDIKKETQSLIVMPVISPSEARSKWAEYEQLKKQIITESDVQKIQGKDFLKKSYWRKLATFFNLSIEVIKEEKEVIGKTMVWHFEVKATAPNGRYSTGVGSCDVFEKAKLIGGKYCTWDNDSKSFIAATPNSIHNTRSTAETRATNRAISNLVGGGEVSAEEVVK